MLTEVEAVLPDINCQNSRDSTSRRIAPASASWIRFVSYATPSTEHSAHKLHRLTNNTV